MWQLTLRLCMYGTEYRRGEIYEIRLNIPAPHALSMPPVLGFKLPGEKRLLKVMGQFE